MTIAAIWLIWAAFGCLTNLLRREFPERKWSIRAMAVYATAAAITATLSLTTT